MHATQAELWRTVPQFAGILEASNHGQIRSVDREVNHPKGGKRLIPGRVRKFQHTPNGYLHVVLCIDNRRIGAYAHRLVCEAFHGPAPEGYEVRHLNGVRDDNRAENLRWGTRAEQEADKVRHGTRVLKVECIRGHRYEGDNVRIRSDGSRACGACARWRDQQRRARQ